MKPTRIRWAAWGAGLCLVSLLASGCASRRVAPFEQDADRYRFSFRLSRGFGETGACAASVSVTDLETKKKMAIPLFTAAWGVASESSVIDPRYGARLVATVRVAADGTKGECRAALYRGETLLASRETSVPVSMATRPSKIKYR